MAFALKIISATEDGQKFEIEPAWWNIKELRSSYNFTEVGKQSYQDFKLYADKRTFEEIIMSQEKYRDQGVYSYGGWKNINAKMYAALQKLLKLLSESDQIIIRIYEWESGLD